MLALFDCAGALQDERDAALAVRIALAQSNQERDAALGEQQTRLQRMSAHQRAYTNRLRCSQVTTACSTKLEAHQREVEQATQERITQTAVLQAENELLQRRLQGIAATIN